MAVRLVLVSVAVTALACEETDPPHDDSLCSWATDGEACSPLSPRDLFDVDSIQAMSLTDLGWRSNGMQTYEGVQGAGGQGHRLVHGSAQYGTSWSVELHAQ